MNTRTFLIFIPIFFLTAQAYQYVSLTAVYKLPGFKFLYKNTLSIQSGYLSLGKKITLHDVRVLRKNNSFLSIGKVRMNYKDAGKLLVYSLFLPYRCLFFNTEAAAQELTVKFNGEFQDMKIPGYDKLPILKDTAGQFKVFVKWNEGTQAIQTSIDATLEKIMSIKTDNIKLMVSGAYYGTEKSFTIERANMWSSQFGKIELAGKVKNLASTSPEYHGEITFHDVSLAFLHENFFHNHGNKMLIQGLLNGSVEIEGSPSKILNWNTSLSVKKPFFRHQIWPFDLKNSLFHFKTNGSYDHKKDQIEVSFFQADFSEIFKLKLKGTANQVFTDNPVLDFNLVGKGIPVSVLEPLIKIADIELDSIDGYWDGLLSVSGSLKAVELNGLFDIKTENVKTKGLVIGSLNILLPLIYRNSTWSLDKIFIDAHNMAYEDSRDNEYHAANLMLTLPYLKITKNLFSGKYTIRITGGSFESEDGNKVIERGSFSLSGEFEIPLLLQKTSIQVQGKILDLEMLWGKFYRRFRNNINFTFKGQYNHKTSLFSLLSSEISIKDTGNIELSGRISKKQPFVRKARISAAFINQKMFNLIFQDAFWDNSSFLYHLKLGGKTQLDISVEPGFNTYKVRGRAVVIDGSVSRAEADFSVKGINLELPINVTYPQSTSDFEKPYFGIFKIERINWKKLVIKNILCFPSLWNNSVFLKYDPEINALGGLIKLQKTQYTNILSPDRILKMSIILNGIDLRQLSSSLGLQKFRGTLSGKIHKAVLTSGSLKTKGEVVFNVFDGQVKMHNFSVTSVGIVNQIKASLTFSSIDLGKLTRTFKFGQVTGVVEGYINDLVIANGQAESFKASLQSVPKSGVEQWISVKALKEVSILGSGEPNSILNRGIYQFLKKYKYEKLGFKASVKNDRLRLQGIETEGDKEYLVKGSLLPPTVDVITHIQEISFSDLMKRLRRIKNSD